MDVGRLIEEVLHKGWDEFAEYVNPLIAQRASLAGEPVRLRRAPSGALLDADGRELEDLHGTQMLGHRNPVVAEAVTRFLASDAANWYPSRVNPFAGRLARRLCERTGYSNAYFGMSGSDAVEAAVKLARAATGRPRVLALAGAYHGCGLGSTALMTPGPFRDVFGPHLPGAETLPFGDTDALARAFAGGGVAAVVVEPVQGEGGVRPLPPDYVQALCELSARHDAVLVADEVQTGLGRIGRAATHRHLAAAAGRRVAGQGAGRGLLPISAMLTDRQLFERAYGATSRSASPTTAPSASTPSPRWRRWPRWSC